MSNLIDTIKALPGLMQFKPPSADEIAEAEKKLGLSFANEYKEYLSEFGEVDADDIELTGIIPELNNWSVVDLTLRERELALECGYDDITNNIYAVEDTGMDGIVVWQDSDGYIYV
ncbi:MAG: SMI1/KNR4 family protein, partial [Clostridiales bacterium]|nr:SMI1/KNR4 family protein [Clostridiales bacterium]